jgi:hypothetical protein
MEKRKALEFSCMHQHEQETVPGISHEVPINGTGFPEALVG